MEIAPYFIKISYYYDESKDIVNDNLSFQEYTTGVFGHTANVKKTKSDTTKTNGYKIQYDEISTVISNGERGKRAEIRIFDFNPGIYIDVSEQISNSFDKYRNELNAMIKSIKFYPGFEKQ